MNIAADLLESAPFLTMDNRYKLIIPEPTDAGLIERLADDLSELIDAGILSAFSQINLHGRPAFSVAYAKAGAAE